MLSNCCPLLSESLPSRDTFKVFNPYRHRFKGFCPYNFTDGNLIGLFGIIYSNVKNLTKWFENILKKLSELQYNNYEIIAVGLIKKIYLVERIEIQKKRKNCFAENYRIACENAEWRFCKIYFVKGCSYVLLLKQRVMAWIIQNRVDT